MSDKKKISKQIEDFINDRDQVLSFAQTLAQAGKLDADTVYYFEKPWKWADEYRKWVQLGSPEEGSGDQWDKFTAFLEDAA